MSVAASVQCHTEDPIRQRRGQKKGQNGGLEGKKENGPYPKVLFLICRKPEAAKTWISGSGLVTPLVSACGQQNKNSV